MAFFSKKQHEWNPPWKSADEVFSEDFSKLLIKDLQYLQQNPEAWKVYALSNCDICPASTLPPRGSLLSEIFTGNNQTILRMHASHHRFGPNEYTMPVYATEKQLNDDYPGVKILDKKAGVHITYNQTIYRDWKGATLTEKEYNALPIYLKGKPVQLQQSVKVYNIDNTNFKKIYPKEYSDLEAHHNRLEKAILEEERFDAGNIYTDPVIEEMKNNWLCEVYEEPLAQTAYYSSAGNCIWLPSKNRFMTGKTPQEKKLNGMRRISVLIHECMHSTARKFGRKFGKKFGDAKYAREELVAEIGTLMTGLLLGLPPQILRNNECYISSWLKSCQKNPNYVKSVLKDARKASREFINQYNIQAKKLKKPTIKLLPEKNPLISRILSGISNLSQRFVNMFSHHSGWNQQSSPDKTTKVSEKKPKAALNPHDTRKSSMEKEAPAVSVRKTVTAMQAETPAAAERTTKLAGADGNGRPNIDGGAAQRAFLEQVVAAANPGVSKEELAKITAAVIAIAENTKSKIMAADSKTKSLNEKHYSKSCNSRKNLQR